MLVSNENPLSDRTAIVTGGGGSIGTAISVRLAKENANVVIAQRSAESGEEVVSRIDTLGGEAIFVQTDMNSESDIQSLVEKTVREFDSADIIVNNAVNPKKDRASEMSRECWEEILTTNLTGPFRLAQHAYQYMKENGFGRVINIGAIQACSPLAGAVAYTSSKSGLEGLTRSLAVEWSSPTITVNTVRVGPVYGNDWAGDNGRPEEVPVEDAYENVPPEIDAEAATLTGRIGRPNDIAALVAFLARPESGFITGASIPCDGGRLISRAAEPFDQERSLE